MSIPALPNELLRDIFSHLASSKSTLFHVSLAFRAFCDIAKPLLYSHIIITTSRQRELLKRVRKEDAKLIQKLVIDRLGADKAAAHVHRDSGHSCLVELFQGDFLDVSSLKTLHVRCMLSQRDGPLLDLDKIKPASNLVELSVQVHYLGGDFWDAVLLEPRNRPKLSRAAFFGVSYGENPEGGQVFHRDHLRDSPLLPSLASHLDVLLLGHQFGDRFGSQTYKGSVRGSNILVCSDELDYLVKGWKTAHGLNLYLLPETSMRISSVPGCLKKLLEAAKLVPRQRSFFSLPWSYRYLSSTGKSIRHSRI
ncbi:F-box protein [Sporobolomyces salmoneus]|uniref:F-box protein n=1 Tax=Sporobolomyces salmoneus TaxID=183962 RepID=UPI00317BF948